MKLVTQTLFLLAAISTNFCFSKPTFPKTNSCIVNVNETPQEVAEKAAHIFLEEINKSKALEQKLVVILPTGGTTIPFYKKLVSLWNEGKLDLSKVVTFNLDEYVDLPPDHEQSYHYFMNHHFFDLVKSKLTNRLLESLGLTSALKEDLSHANLENLSTIDVNYAINLLKNNILETFKREKHDTYQSVLDSLKRIDSALQRENSAYQLVSHYLLTDKKFPSLTTLAAGILHHFCLSNSAIAEDNIHIPDGYAKDPEELEKKIHEYKKAFEIERSKPSTRLVVFCGIGVDPAHIAFNDLLKEEEYQDDSLTEEELTYKALHSKFRLIELTEETRRVNSRFFDYEINAVPTHAVTFGFSELLRADRFVLMAFGTSKAKALYRTFASLKPTYKVPASLIRFLKDTKPELIIDKKAFGLYKLDQESLAKIVHNMTEKSLKTLFSLKNEASETHLFDDIPQKEKPCCVLNDVNSFTKDSIHLVKLPQAKKILWISKNGHNESELLKELKKKNEIQKIAFKNFQSIEKAIDEFGPDYLYLPECFRKKSNQKKLNELVSKYSKGKVVAIYYAENYYKKNLTLPLTKLTLDRKIEALKRFHQSQVKRTPFDVIIRSLAEISTVEIDHKSFPSEFYYVKKFKVQKNGSVTLSAIQNSLLTPRDLPIQKKPKSLKKLQLGGDDLIIAVAPHPDDAEIGLGALLHEAGKQHIQSIVLNATSGSRAQISRSDLLNSSTLPEQILSEVRKCSKDQIENLQLKKNIRASESTQAIEYLNSRCTVQFLNLPFYHAKGYEFGNEDKHAVDEALDTYLSQKDGDIYVFLPRKNDEHIAHRQTTKLFTERVKHYFKSHPEKSIYLAFYTTPWTGEWNLYFYNDHQGSALAALSGSERLLKKGAKGYLPKFLGGHLAERYFVSHIVKKKS